MRPAAGLLLVVAVTACEKRDVPLVQLPARLLGPPAAEAGAPPAAVVDPGYVGADACAECHAERFNEVRRTAHFRTTAAVTKDVLEAPVDGSAVVTSAAGLRIEVSDKGGELWQTAVDEMKDERMSRRMDVVIGSGKIAQTFLSWEKDRLYELPATWFAKVGWRYSPGFLEDRVDFARPVVGQCLECHALWAQPGHPDLVHDNSFVGKIWWGVTCEKCHGPGKEHVAWGQENRKAEHGEKIVMPSKLSRERNDDVCLLCHASRGKDVAPVFTYRPGDELAAHYGAAEPVAPGPGDVLHSFDQGDRLHASKCWQKSDMTCITCHNPHRSEHGNDLGFMERCLGCHEQKTLSQKAGESKHDGKTPCLDCHMPKRGTEAEKLAAGGSERRAEMRDHKIAVY